MYRLAWLLLLFILLIILAVRFGLSLSTDSRRFSWNAQSKSKQLTKLFAGIFRFHECFAHQKGVDAMSAHQIHVRRS